VYFIAKTFQGLEEVLAKELSGIGAEEVTPITRAVQFAGDKQMLYKANYMCRTALRVLMPVSSFLAKDEKMLYDGVRQVPWEKFLHFSGTFAIDSVVSYSSFNHSGFVTLKAKDAIADRFRDKYAKRPNVEAKNPDVRVNVHIFRDQCTVSLDSSGASLHLRGYRHAFSEAPLNEVLAAGLIHLSGWDGKTPLWDPMCGSGTILTEAALIAGKVPAGYYREQFGFEKWRDFDKDLWYRVKRECEEDIQEPGMIFRGIDIDEGAIRASIKNIEEGGLEKIVKVEQGDFFEADSPFPRGFIITNPPYGERIKVDDLTKFYQDFGDRLKQKYAGFTAWVMTYDEGFAKFIGLRPSRRIKVMNGPLECRFLKFDLYEGKKYSNSPQ
jgi:putative N6-adenine-specific DNA methylase